MNLSEKQQQFAREYSELFDYLYRYVCYRIPVREDAEDLISEIFTKAYQRLDQYDHDKGALRQWLTGFARNHVLMYWRDRKTMVNLDELPEISDDTTQSNALDSLHDKLFVERMLESLPQDKKALLALRYIDEMTYDEIASAIGKEPAAIRQFFSRLHKQLRIEFEEQYV